MSAADARAAELAPARRGGYRHLTFDNGRFEDYDSVFVQHAAGEWDRILVARDDGTIATLVADLINAAAVPPRPRLQDRQADVGFALQGDDLATVLSAVDHLLLDHDCDLVGYEEVMGARDRLRAGRLEENRR